MGIARCDERQEVDGQQELDGQQEVNISVQGLSILVIICGRPS